MTYQVSKGVYCFKMRFKKKKILEDTLMIGDILAGAKQELDSVTTVFDCSDSSSFVRMISHSLLMKT